MMHRKPADEGKQGLRLPAEKKSGLLEASFSTRALFDRQKRWSKKLMTEKGVLVVEFLWLGP